MYAEMDKYHVTPLLAALGLVLGHRGPAADADDIPVLG